MTTPRRAARDWGKVRKLPSGRYQASYAGPDGQRHNAPATFGTKPDAGGWLAAQQTDIARGTWRPPGPPRAVPVRAPTPRRGCGPGLSGRSTGEYRRSCTGT